MAEHAELAHKGSLGGAEVKKRHIYVVYVMFLKQILRICSSVCIFWTL